MRKHRFFEWRTNVIKSLTKWIAALALTLPLAANASILQFDATLNAASEVNVPQNFTFNGLASATASLFYNTIANTYNLQLTASNLSGTITGAHIHGQASTSQNAGVLVGLNSSPFVFLQSGGSLLLIGNNIAAPVGLIGAANSNPAASFLSILQAGRAYINIHTGTNPGGEIRGQLFQVAVVPELEVYAMLLAGLGLIGFIARRRLRG